MLTFIDVGREIVESTDVEIEMVTLLICSTHALMGVYNYTSRSTLTRVRRYRREQGKSLLA